jgi:hypothetical protein
LHIHPAAPPSAASPVAPPALQKRL